MKIFCCHHGEALTRLSLKKKASQERTLVPTRNELKRLKRHNSFSNFWSGNSQGNNSCVIRDCMAGHLHCTILFLTSTRNTILMVLSMVLLTAIEYNILDSRLNGI